MDDGLPGRLDGGCVAHATAQNARQRRSRADSGARRHRGARGGSRMNEVFRVWEYEAVSWGDTLCEAPGCLRAAELLADFDERRREGVPVCVSDADVLLDRACAVAILPGSPLPDPWEYQR